MKIISFIQNEIAKTKWQFLLGWLVGIIFLRVWLEMTFVAPAVYTNIFSFVFQSLWFGITCMLSAWWLQWWFKISWRTVLELISLGGVVILLPVIHAIVFDYHIYFEFLYGSFSEIMYHLATFCFHYGGVGRGLAWELSIVFLVIFIFGICVSRSWWKSLVAALVNHFVIIGTMGSIGAIVGPQLVLDNTLIQYIPNELSFWLVPSVLDVNRFIYQLFILLFILVGWGMAGYVFPKQTQAVLKNIRFERVCLFWILGLAVIPFVQSPVAVFDFIIVAVVYALIWLYAIVLNDIYDLPIDRLSNRLRPLVQKVISVRDYCWVGIIAAFIAWLLTWPYAFWVQGVFWGSIIIGVVYSVPPIRLRQFWFGVLLSTASQASIFLLAYGMLTDATAVPEFILYKFLWLWLIIALAFQVKDLKDFTGDKANGVKNIVTLFGWQAGKKIIAGILLVALGLLLWWIQPIYETTHYMLLYVVTGVVMVATVGHIALREKPNEKNIFASMFMYFIFLAVLYYFN